MLAKGDYAILEAAIDSLDVSVEFKAMAKENGFFTLGAMLSVPAQTLVRLPKSGYRLLAEFLQLLEQHDLMHLTDD
jgi:DNA-directed RNA polymerase alpha subunit